MTETFSVTPTGVGRADYSISIEKSVHPAIISATTHQSRYASSFKYAGLPTLVYPDVYWILFGWFDKAGDPTWAAPSDVDWFIEQFFIGGDTIATSVVILAYFDAADLAYGSPIGTGTYLAQKFAPKNAVIKFTKGIKLIADKYYFLGAAHYSVNPFFDLTEYLEAMADVPAMQKLLSI